MTIRHHPEDNLLAAFVAGWLDLGQHVAIATHLASCAQCRSFVRSLEQVGGCVLSALPATPLATSAVTAAKSRLPDASVNEEPAPRPALVDVPALPGFVRNYAMGSWQWVAPRVRLRRIALPRASRTRVFLLRSGPGTRMLQHSHDGIELTCVLSGAFRHAGGRFGPGDFDFGDAAVDHQPTVDEHEECVCLVAMQGDLRLNGVLGRLLQPFVRL